MGKKQDQSDNKRRGRGDRKIFFDESRGKYVGQLSFVDDKTGKRYRPKVYADSESECRAMTKAKEREIENGLKPNKGSKYTLGQWLDEWFEKFQSAQLRIKTKARQKLAITHIKERIGDIKLGKLDTEDVQGLYAGLLKDGKKQRGRRPKNGEAPKPKPPEGLSSSSVRYCHCVLHKAIKKAVALGYMRFNVTDETELPKKSQIDRQAMNQDQVKQFLAVAKKNRMYAAFLLALATGLRRGELLALSWDDVDLEKRTLRVRRSLLECHKEGVFFDDVKSKSSRRNVSFPPDVAVELKRHKARQAAEELKARGKAKEHSEKFKVEVDPATYYKDHGLLFQQTNGERMDPRSVARIFTLLLDKAKLPRFSLHCLRHTFATLMLQKGVHLKVVQEALGHATIQQTADTYSHVMPGMQDQAAMCLQGMFIEQETEPEESKKA